MIQLGPDPRKWPELFKTRYAERLSRTQHQPLTQYQSDPQGYSRNVLGVRLTPDQSTMLQSIVDNRRTLVKASHAIGKTFTAAVAESWWFDCWSKHIGYITAPTWPQAFGLTFKQLKQLRRSKSLPGTILEKEIRDADRNAEGYHYIRALNAETGEGFQGEHSAPILIVIEEGVGVPKYIWDAVGGLMTHPECFVGDTSVSASQVNAASARFYQGRIIKIATANKRNLTVTPNHPILTLRGWVPAQRLQVGDQLIASSDVQAVTSRINPNKENIPAAICEVFQSLSRTGSNTRREGSRLQFHGDGLNGEVEVVYPNGFLRSEDDLALSEPISKQGFMRGQLANTFNRISSLAQFGLRYDTAPSGGVSSERVPLAFRIRHPCHAQAIAFADTPDLHSLASQGVQDAGYGDAVGCGELIERFSRKIASAEICRSIPAIMPATRTEHDSGVSEVPSKLLAVDSNLARKLMTMFPSEIALDQVVQVRNDEFSGQVYNLHTDTNWYFANGIVAHNCRVFAIGNPTDEATEFGLASESILYNVLSISALDHPNIAAELACQPPPFPDAVRLQWLYEMLEKECERVESPIEDSFEFHALPEVKAALEGRTPSGEQWHYQPTAYFQGRVLGEFPTQADQQVIPKSWLKSMPVRDPVGPYEIGCDIARFGDDRTTIITRRGPCAMNAREIRKMDTVEVEAALKDEALRVSSSEFEAKHVAIKIDVTGGLGAGPYDHLKAAGWNVHAINSSEKANNEEQYKNRRSELWFDTRDRAREKRLDLSRLRKDIRERLERELSAPKYKAAGQKVVEDKAQMKQRLGYSPDLADGLNLAFAPLGKKVRVFNW